MKKSEIVLLWIAGLWAVACLMAIASGDKWSSGLALILAGWVFCFLIWISLRKWPKGAAAPPTRADTLWNKAKAFAPRAFWPSLGYVLAVFFLFGWIHAREQIRAERRAISRIVSGHFEVSDCKSLAEPQASRCVVRRLGFVPDSDLPDSWENVQAEMQPIQRD